MSKMFRLLPIWAATLVSAASAQSVTLKPLADVRIRFENVDQDGLADQADALTVRVRPGIQATKGQWSALVEAEGTLALIEGFNSGTNGKTAFPNIIDPQNIEVNRIQMRYADSDGTTVTAGRQILELADERFVGS